MFLLKMSGLSSTRLLSQRPIDRHSLLDPLGWPPGCQQNLPEDLRPFLLAQSKKRCSGILQVVSRPDGWETKSDHSKSTFAVTASHSRTIQQNHC